MLIYLSEGTYENCKAFAEQRTNESKRVYAFRGEYNPDKVSIDVLSGALAEFAVYELLISYNIDTTIPSLEITKSKSYCPDLNTKDFRIHVKSQTLLSKQRYGQSYLFQKKDTLVIDPAQEDLIVFTTVDVENRCVEIVGCLKAKEILNWDKCKVPRYRDHKVAIYLKDHKVLNFLDTVNI